VWIADHGGELTLSDFKEKIRSVNFGLQSRRGPKVTTDVHDHHKVAVTEHWNDRVDVNVIAPKTVMNPHIRPKFDQEKEKP
jgi:hypothetical protein